MAIAEKNQAAIHDRLAMLGIPREEMTPSVSLAVSALIEKLDDTNRDLTRTKASLQEIEQLVDVDCLVPIPNRRAFMRRLAWAIAMHERYGHAVSVLFFDLNDMKAINDTYGHAVGDQAIRHMAQALSNGIRQSDYLARIAGDEFALIFYYADREQALARARIISEGLIAKPLSVNGKPLTITSAYGVYELRQGDTEDSALAAADTAMYVHKRAIKNDRTDIVT